MNALFVILTVLIVLAAILLIIVVLLQNGKGINPARIEACGHGEFAPKVANDSPEHKAMNRRTEIIITPNLEALLEEMGN